MPLIRYVMLSVRPLLDPHSRNFAEWGLIGFVSNAESFDIGTRRQGRQEDTDSGQSSHHAER